MSKDKIKSIIVNFAKMLIILATLVILPQWNEMWHEFGKNIFHIFH